MPEGAQVVKCVKPAAAAALDQHVWAANSTGMWPLSWLQRRRARGDARRAAEDMYDRYGVEAEKLVRSFLNSADGEGEEQARRHWRAVRSELKRIAGRRAQRMRGK